MKTSFDKAFEHTVGLEGVYSNHPADRGGATKYGITQAVARKNGYAGAMVDLPLETAKAIYKKSYWDKLRLDDIAKISEPIAMELFDTGVNMGDGTAGKFLQRAINCFEVRDEIRPPLVVDGIIGQKTIDRLLMREFSIRYIGEDWVILKMLNAQQCVRYMEIVEKDPSQALFLRGWISKRVGL